MEFGSAPMIQVGLPVVTVALGGVGGLGAGQPAGLAGLLAVEAVAWRGG